jgi:hypothetical protein
VGASAQPIIGLWNGSGAKNLVINTLFLNVTTIANTAVSPGGFMWLYSNNNVAISTGSSPINLATLSATASVAKAFAISTALTGMSNSLAILRPTGVETINAAGPGTAISQSTHGYEAVDGGIIVPPLSVIAVMGALSTTTISVSAGLVWEEVPIL